MRYLGQYTRCILTMMMMMMMTSRSRSTTIETGSTDPIGKSFRPIISPLTTYPAPGLPPSTTTAHRVYMYVQYIHGGGVLGGESL